MNARELLAGLRGKGFSIILHNGGVGIDPASALSQTDRQILKQHRAEVIASLFAEALDAAMGRIASVYRPGLRDRLEATRPEVLFELDGLEAELNGLALSGDLASAVEALSHWENTWRGACAADLFAQENGQTAPQSTCPLEQTIEVKTENRGHFDQCDPTVTKGEVLV